MVIRSNRVLSLLLLSFLFGCAEAVTESEVTTDTDNIRTAKETDDSTNESTEMVFTQGASDEHCILNNANRDGSNFRISRLAVPSSAADGESLGCTVSGSNGGIGLTGLIALLGFDLNGLVTRDNAGMIPSLIVGEIEGWNANETDRDVSALRLSFLGDSSQPDGDSFTLTPNAGLAFESDASVSCDKLDTAANRLSFPVPLVSDEHYTQLSLDATHITATVNDGDISLTRGTINGYLTRQGILEIIQGLQDACRSPSGPELCGVDNPILTTDPQTLVDFTAAGALGGFDTILTSNGPESCSGGTCDAVSVCIYFETTPIELISR